MLQLKFVQLGPGTIHASIKSVQGLPSPLIFIVSSWARADGVQTETAIVGPLGGELKELFPHHIDADLLDAICMEEVTKSGDPAFSILRHTDGEYCVLCWPKYLEVTLYSWNGSKFLRGKSKKTQKLHPDWSSAAKELGVRCDLEVLTSTMK